MMIRSTLSRPLAWQIKKAHAKWHRDAVACQKSIFDELKRRGAKTKFGADHGFDSIITHSDFVRNVPIRDYEGLKPYIEQIKMGGRDVLWPGRPIYFAKTSGTTSGVKYIPLTSESMPNHISGARDALLHYIADTGNAKFLDKKLIFLSGSPVLTETAGIKTGRLSGIVNHHVPKYLRSNQLPSYTTNCIDDWEEKLEKIIDETIEQPMGLISGIPPWVQMYFDRIQERTGKTISEVFPYFSLLVYGGVNFSPYRQKLFNSIGKPIDSVETFPASEGFFAFQDVQKSEGLLLLVNSGIFFEFIPLEEIDKPNPIRLTLADVELDKNYALIVNNNAGLWGYNIGDTIKFVSKNPYRVLVTGRTKHFISAFGEHVIANEVEQALQFAVSQHPETEVVEFTVAPQVNPSDGQPHHEWLIEFAKRPANLPTFARNIDKKLCELNIYYRDLIDGNILEPLRITTLPPNAFINHMRSIGKLGGQNKPPRLANDRNFAEQLLANIR